MHRSYRQFLDLHENHGLEYDLARNQCFSLENLIRVVDGLAQAFGVLVERLHTLEAAKGDYCRAALVQAGMPAPMRGGSNNAETSFPCFVPAWPF